MLQGQRSERGLRLAEVPEISNTAQTEEVGGGGKVVNDTGGW
jgi:hypothetical protein